MSNSRYNSSTVLKTSDNRPYYKGKFYFNINIRFIKYYWINKFV